MTFTNNFPDRLGLLIAIPSRGMVHISWAMHTLKLAHFMPNNLTYAYSYIGGAPVDQARTRLVEIALRHQAKYIMFLDDDVLIPPNGISRLFRLNAPIATGLVFTKADPSLPVIFRGRGEGNFLDWRLGDIVEADGAGLACCLIKTEVFEMIEPPWFAWEIEEETGEEGEVHRRKIGEDLYFYEKANEAGIRALCDTSVLCGHLDVESGEIFPPPWPEKGITEDKLKMFK